MIPVHFEEQGNRKDQVTRSFMTFMICTTHQTLFWLSNQEKLDGQGMWHIMGGRGSACKVLVGKPEGKRQLGRPRPGGKIILKWIFKKWNGEAWTGLIWLRKGTGFRGM